MEAIPCGDDASPARVQTLHVSSAGKNTMKDGEQSLCNPCEGPPRFSNDKIMPNTLSDDNILGLQANQERG